jgi:hypothetical protein
MTTAAATDNDVPFGDMNGPLAYWGPAADPAPLVVHRARPLADPLAPAEQDALSRLSQTLHGRTWAGTSALMSALLAPEAGVLATC